MSQPRQLGRRTPMRSSSARSLSRSCRPGSVDILAHQLILPLPAQKPGLLLGPLVGPNDGKTVPRLLASKGEKSRHGTLRPSADPRKEYLGETESQESDNVTAVAWSCSRSQD